FVPSFGGTDVLGMGIVVGEQTFLVGREPEEVILLLDPLHRRAQRFPPNGVGADRGLFFIEECFLPDRVPAGVGVAEDVAGGFHTLPQLLGGAVMPLLRRANEVVVG